MRPVTAFLVAQLILGQAACSTVQYLTQQAAGQLRLLRARRRVADVIADPATSDTLRQRLRLAMEARRFGIEVLGMRDGAEFTRYVDTGGPVAYSVSAARKTELVPMLWHFPLIGSVPYLGFFDREAARAEARRLKRAGYDIYLRSISGYSTLGYLLSPIYASMVDEPGEGGELRTVEVVLHEMAHTTAYINSASELNESYATLVGVQGAALFFQQRGRPEYGQKVLLGAVEQERQAEAFSNWLQPVLKDLGGLYQQARKERWPVAETLRRREEFFARARDSYRAAFPPGQRYRILSDGPLNNAVLLAFGVYHRSGTFQQDLLGSVHGDLRAFIALYRRAAQHGDGARWLRTLAEDYRKAK